MAERFAAGRLVALALPALEAPSFDKAAAAWFRGAAQSVGVGATSGLRDLIGDH